MTFAGDERTRLEALLLEDMPNKVSSLPMGNRSATTQLEKDLQVIIGRLGIVVRAIAQGATIHNGELFTAEVKVSNWTGHDLENVVVRGQKTRFAEIVGSQSIYLGKMVLGESKVGKLTCKALQATPIGPPTDTLIQVSVQANVNFLESRQQQIKGAIEG